MDASADRSFEARGRFWPTLKEIFRPQKFGKMFANQSGLVAISTLVELP